MFEEIESPDKCEIRFVIRFLTTRNMSASDIHRLITEVYGTEEMSDSKARKWVRKSKDGRTNIHNEDHSGQPSVITDDLIQAVETKIRENRRFMINTHSLVFPDVSRSGCTKL
ncbi:HTH_48 domain-containing protein [Trichonephila clavipes]|nr:HTH_48 domain-containing protein [Trichonephila clavipes]